MKRILVLERDENQARRLEDSLRPPEWEPVTVSTLRDACRLLAEQPFAAAIVPRRNAILHSQTLHTAHPGLRIVVNQDAAANGLENPDHADAATPSGIIDILQALLAEEGGSEAVDEGSVMEGSPAETLTAAWRDLDADGAVPMIVLAEGPKVIATAGWVDPGLAERVAARTSGSWRAGPETLRLQWLEGSETDETVKLQTRQTGRYLLTVVAWPMTPLSTMRRVGDKLAQRLGPIPRVDGARLGAGRPQSDENEPNPPGGRGGTFAIAWRAVDRLPGPIQNVAHEEILQLGRENGISIRYASVGSRLAHVVATSPDGRDSAWLARCFKARTEAAIRRRFGILVRLWQPGYLAVETDRLLTGFELAMLPDGDDAPELD